MEKPVKGGMDMDEIMKRGNTRKFKDQPVGDEEIQQLLRAAMQARTAGNQTPWHFIVVRNEALIKALAHNSMTAGPIRKAPVALVLLGDSRGLTFPESWTMDLAAAAENILIEAEHLGLGTLWISVYPNEDRIRHIRSLFEMPLEVTPFCIIPVGYPADRPIRLNHFDASRIHYDAF